MERCKRARPVEDAVSKEAEESRVSREDAIALRDELDRRTKTLDEMTEALRMSRGYAAKLRHELEQLERTVASQRHIAPNSPLLFGLCYQHNHHILMVEQLGEGQLISLLWQLVRSHLHESNTNKVIIFVQNHATRNLLALSLDDERVRVTADAKATSDVGATLVVQVGAPPNIDVFSTRVGSARLGAKSLLLLSSVEAAALREKLSGVQFDPQDLQELLPAADGQLHPLPDDKLAKDVVANLVTTYTSMALLGKDDKPKAVVRHAQAMLGRGLASKAADNLHFRDKATASVAAEVCKLLRGPIAM